MIKHRSSCRGWGRSLTKSSITCLTTALLSFASVANSNADTSDFYQPPSDLSVYERGDVIAYERERHMVKSLFNGTKATRIMYLSEGENGQPVAVTGMLFQPRGTAPERGWPIVGWGHGTVGLGDDCAPSKHADLDIGQGFFGKKYNKGPKSPGTLVGRLVDQGYVVIAPDYEGLGTPGAHTYQSADSAGRALLDGVVAARHMIEETTDDFALIGHSQGAIAALHANELPLSDAAISEGLNLVGVVGMGTYYLDADALFGLFYAGDINLYSIFGYTAAGIQAVNPGWDPANLLGSETLATFEDAKELCFIDYGALFPVPYTELTEALNPDFVTDPVVMSFLSKNTPGQHSQNAPVLLQWGEHEAFAAAPQIVEPLCGTGADIGIDVYKNTDHFGVTLRGRADAFTWIRERFAGLSAPNDCP